MRLFRIWNKANDGLWVFAADETDAKAVAVEAGHVRSEANVTRFEDQTDAFLDGDRERGLTDTRRALDSGRRGAAARRVPAINGADFVAALRERRTPQSTGGTNWVIAGAEV